MTAALSLLGCADPNGTSPWTSPHSDERIPDLRLELDPRGSTLFFVNESDGTVSYVNALGDAPEAWRFEAKQADGSWVNRGDLAGCSVMDLAEPTDVASMDAAELEGVDGAVSVPGTFRYVLEVGTESGARYEVTRELTVIGWTPEVVPEARELLARADELGCSVTANAIRRGLMENLTPEGLASLEKGATDELEALDIRMAMLRRGTFTHELARRLAIAEIDEVRLASTVLMASGQPEVRRVLARRYFDELDRLAPDEVAEDGDVSWLMSYAAQWPQNASERIVRYVLRGRGDEQLDWVLRLFRPTSRERFDPFMPALLEGLRARCRHASGAVAESCAEVDAWLTESEQILLGWGFGASFGCGGGFSESGAACVALREDWAALARRAGEVRLEQGPSQVRPVLGGSAEAEPSANPLNY